MEERESRGDRCQKEIARWPVYVMYEMSYEQRCLFDLCSRTTTSLCKTSRYIGASFAEVLLPGRRGRNRYPVAQMA